jgi:TolA-binding protein
MSDPPGPIADGLAPPAADRARGIPASQVAPGPDRFAMTKIEAADRMRDGGRVDEALRVYDEVVRRFPSRPPAEIAAARARELREKTGAATPADAATEPAAVAPESAPSSAEAPPPDAAQLERWVELGDALAKQGNAALARRYYDKILRHFPGTSEAAHASAALQQLGPAPTTNAKTDGVEP